MMTLMPPEQIEQQFYQMTMTLTPPEQIEYQIEQQFYQMMMTLMSPEQIEQQFYQMIMTLMPPEQIEQHFYQNRENAIDKWSQIKLIQTTNLNEVLNILEAFSKDINPSNDLLDIYSACKRAFHLFLKNLSLLLKLLDSFATNTDLVLENEGTFLDEISGLSAEITNHGFKPEFLHTIQRISLNSYQYINNYISKITSQQLPFIAELQ